MTKEEIKNLAEKIVLGNATEEEILQYNRICAIAETTGSDAIKFSAEEREQLEVSLKKAIYNKAGIGKVHRMYWVKWTAVAASVLLVIGFSWILFVNNKPETSIARNTGKKMDSVAFVIHHEVNTTGKDKNISLPDGSFIVLAANSELTYRTPFIDKRDITLMGKAHFKVAKDKTKPFTVFSKEITTTALGTEFTVTAFEKTGKITVRLYEGKVVIKPADKTNKWMKNDIFLLPGQEFIYGNPIIVRAFKNENVSKEMMDNETRDNPNMPQDNQGSWYMFNNQPLERVLNDLSAFYNVKIIYHKKDVENVYFTGKYDKSEPLETILKRIGILNNLTITKKDTAFIITK
jgi:hypothetical protein